jgi:hypothetical protein
VIVRSDGDPDPRISEVARSLRCEAEYGEHLYPVDCRGRIVAEFLRLGIRHHTPYLFKIDSDTRFDRRFRSVPQIGCCVFGTVQGCGVPHQYSLQGGCIGLTRLAAEKLLNSGLLDSPELDDPRRTWAVAGVNRHRAEGQRLASFDWILAWACDRLGIPLVDWPEVCSWWRKTPPNPQIRHAVVHPDKSLAKSLH